jgi:hypothetical protein
MPAPAPTQIQTFLTAALIGKGFVKKSYVEGRLVTDPTKLPDKLAELVSGLSNGLSQEWAVWQASQTVVIPVTSTPGSPSTGVLP